MRIAVKVYGGKLTLNSAFAQSETIIVRVGSEEKNYILHKELLAHHSGFFRGALSGNFKETDDGVIPLTDVEPEMFAFVIDWMYTGVLDDSAHVHATHDGDDVSFRYHAYVLADRLLIPGLKKAIFEVSFPILFVRSPTLKLLTFAFKNLGDEDPLVRLVLDAYCLNYGLGHIGDATKAHIENLPHEFLIQMMLKFHDTAHMEGKEKRIRREDYTI